MDSLKILIATAEAVPYAKTGGLADVAGALPKSLAKSGNNVRLILPLYKQVDREKYKLELDISDLSASIAGRD
jgi:starch synthase